MAHAWIRHSDLFDVFEQEQTRAAEDATTDIAVVEDESDTEEDTTTRKEHVRRIAKELYDLVINNLPKDLESVINQSTPPSKESLQLSQEYVKSIYPKIIEFFDKSAPYAKHIKRRVEIYCRRVINITEARSAVQYSAYLNGLIYYLVTLYARSSEDVKDYGEQRNDRTSDTYVIPSVSAPQLNKPAPHIKNDDTQSSGTTLGKETSLPGSTSDAYIADVLSDADELIKKFSKAGKKEQRMDGTPLGVRAQYSISVGQQFSDPVYGEGVVTGTAHLDSGFVSVAFGPTSVAYYDASNVAEPSMQQDPVFVCPMDQASITAEDCVGGNGGNTGCGYLVFIEEKPSCRFAQACKEKQQADQTAVLAAGQIAKTAKAHDEAVYSKLANALTSASFGDHGFYSISRFSPATVGALVQRIASGQYGTVVERNNDHSLLVRWADGKESIAWSSEVAGVDAETEQRLKDGGIL